MVINVKINLVEQVKNPTAFEINKNNNETLNLQIGEQNMHTVNVEQIT